MCIADARTLRANEVVVAPSLLLSPSLSRATPGQLQQHAPVWYAGEGGHAPRLRQVTSAREPGNAPDGSSHYHDSSRDCHLPVVTLCCVQIMMHPEIPYSSHGVTS